MPHNCRLLALIALTAAAHATAATDQATPVPDYTRSGAVVADAGSIYAATCEIVEVGPRGNEIARAKAIAGRARAQQAYPYRVRVASRSGDRDTEATQALEATDAVECQTTAIHTAAGERLFIANFVIEMPAPSFVKLDQLLSNPVHQMRFTDQLALGALWGRDEKEITVAARTYRLTIQTGLWEQAVLEHHRPEFFMTADAADGR